MQVTFREARRLIIVLLAAAAFGAVMSLVKGSGGGALGVALLAATWHAAPPRR